jgi:hypothetical protein
MQGISELISGLGDKANTALLILEIVAAVIVIGVAAYLLKTLLGLLSPLGVAVRWMFGIREGQEPNTVVAGFILGLRMFAWAVVIGATAVVLLKLV